MIDSEDFDDVNRVFTAAHDDLSELHRKKKGLGKSRDAKKAMKAIELTMALFRELLGIKYNLQNQLKKAKTVAK
ncbi:MAG: hypothetical protein HY540_07745 [Deltaproteobacteria bacterium]|nr:hypothetical protein [Deltaproteobacteria bacterium]